MAERSVRVAYIGSSASPHNQRWSTYLSRFFELRVFSLEAEPIAGVDVVHFRRPTGTALDYLLLRRRLATAVAEFEPDLIHAHRITSYGAIAARAVAVARRRRNAAFILSVWGEDVFSFPRKSFLHRSFTSRVLYSADRILSTSEVMKRETLRYVDPAREILVTPFGVDTSRFHPRTVAAGGDETSPATVGDDARADSPRRFVVGTVKKLRPRYGVDVLLKAIAIARTRLEPEIDLRAVIVGEGPQRDELERLSRELGLEGAVTFTGRISNETVPGALREFDLFAALSVSDDESFGVAMVEASASGLPVLSTTVGDVPEVVLHGKTGILVPPGDVGAATDAIETFGRDEALRRRMGEAGRAYVVERYDWTQTAQRMRDIYESVYERQRA